MAGRSHDVNHRIGEDENESGAHAHHRARAFCASDVVDEHRTGGAASDGSGLFVAVHAVGLPNAEATLAMEGHKSVSFVRADRRRRVCVRALRALCTSCVGGALLMSACCSSYESDTRSSGISASSSSSSPSAGSAGSSATCRNGARPLLEHTRIDDEPAALLLRAMLHAQLYTTPNDLRRMVRKCGAARAAALRAPPRRLLRLWP